MKDAQKMVKLQYAADKCTFDKAWKHWEYRLRKVTNWRPCVRDPTWNDGISYRRKYNIDAVLNYERGIKR